MFFFILKFVMYTLLIVLKRNEHANMNRAYIWQEYYFIIRLKVLANNLTVQPPIILSVRFYSIERTLLSHFVQQCKKHDFVL
jgi:hypothetical protein